MDTYRRRKFFGDIVSKERLYMPAPKSDLLTEEEIWKLINSGHEYVPEVKKPKHTKKFNKILKQIIKEYNL